MADLARNTAINIFSRNLDLIFVVAVVCLITIIFLPLPPFLIDLLIILNITLSLLVLMTSVYVREPLQFSVFPSVLLITTAYRLALNIATTRMILTQAATAKEYAAGRMIQVFGTMVAGNQPLIGFIIFIIIFLIQFIVITKGANRISEVAARFVLDALPGKQMSIDAEVNAGLIPPAEAHQRREQIGREADFYGAMDGAAKFVRGDAIAAIVIAVVNIFGGILLGYLKYGMGLQESLNVFTKLTIGDGLVSQVPALIVSLSAGLIITRATAESSLGRDFLTQIFSVPKALIVTAGFLLFLSLTPMPSFQLLVVASSIGTIWFVLVKSQKQKDTEAKKQAEKPKPPERVEELLKVDPIELEIGYNLIPLVDAHQGGDLLERITLLRRQLASDLGLVVPPVRIRDNIQLEPSHYAIKIRGIEEAEGMLMSSHLLALESAMVREKVEGLPAVDPAFHTPALWITRETRHQAEAAGYTVVEPSAVVATHLSEVIKSNAPHLLTREEVNSLITTLRETSKNLIEELIPNVMKVGEVQKILQNLLREGVPIRDLAVILEALANYAPKLKEPDLLTEYVRQALGKQVCARLCEKGNKLYAAALDPELEEWIKSGSGFTDQGHTLRFSSEDIQAMARSLAQALESLVRKNHLPVVVSSPPIRVAVRKICETIQPNIHVLSYAELPKGISLEILSTAAPPAPLANKKLQKVL